MLVRSWLYALFLLVSQQGLSFQTYSGEKIGNTQIDPSIKNFRYYISPTYWDLLSGREKPISEFLVESVKYSYEVLNRDLEATGVKFEFAGFQDIDGLRNKSFGQEFQGTIYVDFASRNFVPSVGAFAGVTLQRRIDPSSTYAVGGIVYMNGKKLNWHHPLVEVYSTILHETLHVLGVGHSTNASATMAYTENWNPRLAKDDIAAVSTIYQVADGAAPSVTATLSGVAAMGVEIVWIDALTGKTQLVITNREGVAKIYGLSPGQYYLAARELTPTGPCFETPVRGFLTSFYRSDGASTNSLAEAALVTVTEGTSANYSIKLIAGTKKFDCHFIYSMWCTESSKCAQNRVNAGVTGRANIQNDLTATHHQTDTNTLSGAHSSIVLSAVGSQSPISFGPTILGDGVSTPSVGYDLLNYSVADATIAETASEGTYAGLCTAGSETALISSLIEVMPGDGYVDNRELWPQYESQFTSSSSPRNYEEMLASDPPAKPKKNLGIACGTIKNSALSEGPRGGILVMLILLTPLVLSMMGRKFADLVLPVIVIVAAWSQANSAHAFSLGSGLWLEQESEAEVQTTTKTRFRFSVTPYQQIAGGISLGGKFVYHSTTSKSDSISETETFATFGPAVIFVPPQAAYFYSGLAYLLYPTTTYKTENEITQFGGGGYSVDLGLRASLGKAMLGPLLTYQVTQFKKENTEISERDIDLKKSRLDLAIGFWWDL